MKNRSLLKKKMKNNNKTYGLRKERVAKASLEAQGYEAFRCRGSFGCFDIIACHSIHGWKLVQVKATRQKYASFQQDINTMRAVAVPPNTSKELWIYWSPRKDRVKKGWERIEV